MIAHGFMSCETGTGPASSPEGSVQPSLGVSDMLAHVTAAVNGELGPIAAVAGGLLAVGVVWRLVKNHATGGHGGGGYSKADRAADDAQYRRDTAALRSMERAGY